MTEQPEPEDTCHPVNIDGETIRVRGAGELTDEAREALTSLIRVAKAKMAADPMPVRQQMRARAFNAVAPALQRHGEWLRLTVRRAIADAVLAAVEEFLDIGEAEARRESDAEAAVARVRDACDQLHRASVLADGLPRTDRERGVLQAVERIAAALGEQPARTTPNNPTTSTDTPLTDADGKTVCTCTFDTPCGCGTSAHYQPKEQP
jgi:hypothetical protein